LIDGIKERSHRDQLAEQEPAEVENVALPEGLAKQVDDVIVQQGAITQPETVADCLETSFGELLERANQWRRDEGNGPEKGAMLPKP